MICKITVYTVRRSENGLMPSRIQENSKQRRMNYSFLPGNRIGARRAVFNPATLNKGLECSEISRAVVALLVIEFVKLNTRYLAYQFLIKCTFNPFRSRVFWDPPKAFCP